MSTVFRRCFIMFALRQLSVRLRNRKVNKRLDKTAVLIVALSDNAPVIIFIENNKNKKKG